MTYTEIIKRRIEQLKIKIKETESLTTKTYLKDLLDINERLIKGLIDAERTHKYKF
jgi:hypothetical protein